jgi:DNA invertase Pin-like site-specific DNA recombinase
LAENASGAQRDRPQLAAALDYMRAGDTLVVWKLAQLARSMRQFIQTVVGLRVRQIGFRSPTEAMDTTTAGGTLIFNLFASLAEFERSIIRERTRAVLDAARAGGRVDERPGSLSADDLQQARAAGRSRDPL